MPMAACSNRGARPMPREPRADHQKAMIITVPLVALCCGMTARGGCSMGAPGQGYAPDPVEFDQLKATLKGASDALGLRDFK